MRLTALLLGLLLGLAGCAAPPQAAREPRLPDTPTASPRPSAAPPMTQPAATPAGVRNTPETSGRVQSSASSAGTCPLTEPIWVKPPADSAVQDPPAFGHYFVNQDRSIWASAWWAGRDDYRLRAVEEGVKVGWFRPAGASLAIAGQRLDAQAPALDAHVPCCYPTRFQATGLIFPTQGCWEITATAADRQLSFVVWVEP
ncbi:MAG TPA: hypothetical protein VFU22_28500 [Roseiflexaceae bacterium]|nr:hypothetical protein [Roseiflexaceae bacterium]